ncbi:MAG: hypothetical protein IJN78_06465 [Clostridia bacterium]|nr:hypothetical protein [Clostridia bacterium]
MQRRRFEKVAVMLLSVIMLLTSTGIVSSLAVNVSESSAAPNSSTTASTSASSVTQEGGSITSSTVAVEGGAVVTDNGDGTKENPYKISTLEEFLAIGNKVNNTASADKYFVLMNNIDLSSVTAKDFENGSLVGIDKTLAGSSANVFISLDGNGYSLKGLNVEFTKGEEASVFGTINAKSVIKNLKIDRPVMKSTSDEMSRFAIVAAENKGTISNITVTYPVLTAEKADYSALVVAVNSGTVSDVYVKATHTNISTATADNHTISANGTVGAVAGLNRGTVTNASALNIGMFIPEREKAVVYGGIAGASSGSVQGSVSTGNVKGGKATDVVGGVVGKAVAPVGGKEATSTLTNNYTLVALPNTAEGCGVIGADGKAEMLKDCFWSSAVSGKNVAVTDFGAGVNDLSSQFIIIPEGKKVTLSASDVSATTFGKANVVLDGEIAVKGEGVQAVCADGKAEIIAESAGKVAYATYTAKIMLPATVGAENADATLKQYFKVSLITVSAEAKGNGTAEKPFVIKTASDFNLYKFAPSMNAVLGGDVKISATVPAIKGTFDGNGYTITTAKPIASAVYGTVKNVNISVTADLSSAVLGNAIGASVSGVAVTMADGVKLNAVKNNTGILFNRIGGESKLDDCRVQGSILVGADKLSAIGGFAGLADGKVSVTNSGAVVDITLGEGFTAEKTADFIGSVTAEDTLFEACYFDGDGEFIADKPEKITLKNIVAGWSFDGGKAGFFTGNGGSFTATLPAIKAFGTSAEDYEVIFDGEKLLASVSVADGKLTLMVERVEGVVTVKDMPVSVVNKKTGLSATLLVSNGLEKDADGRYIITTAYDLAYISENIVELSDASFIMMNDVDMSVIGDFAPIGTTDVAFSGTFDGNGKVVKNLTIDGTAKVGLFAVLDGATVRNVKFADADVKSAGGYAAVLAGQVTGEALISGITVEGAKLEAHDLYAGVLVGSVDSADALVTIKDITLKNNSVVSDSNYVGAVAGRVNGKAEISNIAIDSFKADGATYVAGVAGLAIGEIALKNITVSGATLRGVSEVSGIASGNGNVTIKASAVRNSDIATIAITSANTAGGISAVLGSIVEDVSVENTVICAGVAGGIVGKSIADGELTIKNASVIASEINSSDANTVAAGILGVHNVKGTATIENVSVDEKTVISGAAVSAGIVGDCSGAESELELIGAKTLATVNGSMTANAISAAGVLGRIGTSAVNNVELKSVKVGGSVSGAAAVGGIVGLVKDGEAYNGLRTIVSDVVAFADIDASSAASAGVIFGMVEGDVFPTEYQILVARDVIITTYYGVDAYPVEMSTAGYIDLNKGILPSVGTLTTKDETSVKLYGLPTADGYVFDSTTGWTSESADRVQVISSTEKELVLKAERRAQVNIVGYYVLESDDQVRIPVSFTVNSEVYKALEGSGTKAAPYLVKDAYDLEAVSQYADMGAYFVLSEDIVLTDADYDFGGAFHNLGNGVVSIGTEDKPFNGTFTGLYDGKVHSITGLRISADTFGGIFAVADGAVISDLVINGAEVSADVGAGILVGRARNTVIKNISINNSSVETTGNGSVAGGVVGVGEQTTVDGAYLDGVSVRTTLNATKATVETAGAVAGILDGVVKSVRINDAVVESDSIGAGLVGVANGGTYISNVEVFADVKAPVAAGLVGEVNDAMYFGIDTAAIGGNAIGEELASGIIARVKGEDEAKAFDKLTRSLIRETVVTAKVSGVSVRAVAIADVSEKLAVDSENTQAVVFDNVYYSSYQNALGAFGAESFNAYQNGEYEITDLSDIAYSADGVIYPSIKLGAEPTVLSDNSIILNGADGTFKAFTVGGREYVLENITSDIEGIAEYDAAASAVRLAKLPEQPAKLVFVYNGGMEIAIDILAENAQYDENAVNVSCGIVNASGDAELSSKLVAVLLKSKSDNGAESLSFFAKEGSQPDSISAIVLEDGELYVDMLLPEGYTFAVNAVDENGASLVSEDAGNEGILVNAGSASAVSLTITLEKAEEVWGLRALWGAVSK